jgi:hypothetical protein
LLRALRSFVRFLHRARRKSPKSGQAGRRSGPTWPTGQAQRGRKMQESDTFNRAGASFFARSWAMNERGFPVQNRGLSQTFVKVSRIARRDTFWANRLRSFSP